MPEDPRLGNFVEQHLLALQSERPLVLISAFPAKQNEVLFKQEPFPQVQVLYKKHFSLLSHYQALKKAYQFAKNQGFEFELAHLHVCHPSGIAFLGFLRKMPFVITEHYSGYQSIRLKEWSKMGQRVARLIFNQAKMIMPVSEALGKSLVDFGVKTPMKPVGNVVNTDIFNYKGAPPNEYLRFVHISSLQEHTKNISGLVFAFKAYRQSGGKGILAIGGDGDLNSLESKLEALKLESDSYEILPAMEPHEVSLELSKSHCFLLFSKVENQPVVILEALCSGRPFIASEVGGIPEIGDSSNCILIPSGDESALTAAMQKMERDYHQFNLEAIAKKAQAAHGPEAIRTAFEAVYASVRP